jgi:hypothetical protein
MSLVICWLWSCSWLSGHVIVGRCGRPEVRCYLIRGRVVLGRAFWSLSFVVCLWVCAWCIFCIGVLGPLFFYLI